MNKKLVRLDVMGFALKDKSRVITVSAGWEALAFHAGYFVFLCMSRVVDHFVNT